MTHLLQYAGSGDYETTDDAGLLRLEWQNAWNGELYAVVLALHEHEIPYDFYIESGSGPGIDQRGHWRAGMEVPHFWYETDEHAFVWVSSVRTAGRRLRASAAKPDAQAVVSDLRAFLDPRVRRAEDLRSVVHDGSALRTPRRRSRL